MRGYFELWVDVLMQAQHPELFRLLPENEDHDWTKYREWRQAIERDVLQTLRRLIGAKTATGAQITKATIRGVDRSLPKGPH